MSGQTVDDVTGMQACREGKLVADYAGTRHYRWSGLDYYVPECVWRKAESMTWGPWETRVAAKEMFKARSGHAFTGLTDMRLDALLREYRRFGEAVVLHEMTKAMQAQGHDQ